MKCKELNGTMYFKMIEFVNQLKSLSTPDIEFLAKFRNLLETVVSDPSLITDSVMKDFLKYADDNLHERLEKLSSEEEGPKDPGKKDEEKKKDEKKKKDDEDQPEDPDAAAKKAADEAAKKAAEEAAIKAAEEEKARIEREKQEQEEALRKQQEEEEKQKKKDEDNDNKVKDETTGEDASTSGRDATLEKLTISPPVVFDLNDKVEFDNYTDFLLKYFVGANYPLTKFRNYTMHNLISAAFVDFSKPNGVVFNSQEITNNILELRNKYKEEFVDFILELDGNNLVNTSKDQLLNEDMDYLYDLFGKISNMKGLKNSDMLNSLKSLELENTTSLSKGYAAYLTYKNFNMLVTQFLPALKTDGSSYYIKGELKSYNQFDDREVDILKEIGSTTKMVLENLPKLDHKFNIVPNKFIKIKEVSYLVGKIKGMQDAKIKDALLSARFNVNKIKGVFKTILSDRVLMGKFTEDEKQVMRSIYNYFYKDENDTIGRKDTYSLAYMATNKYRDNGVTHSIITNAIDCIIDKTISNEYITTEIINGEIQRKNNKARLNNKYYNVLKTNCINISNQMTVSKFFTWDEKNPSSVLLNVEEIKRQFGVDLPKTSYNLGDVSLFLTLANLTKKKLEALTTNDWNNFANDKKVDLPDSKKKYATAMAIASQAFGINLYRDGGSFVAHKVADLEKFADDLMNLAAKTAIAQNIRRDFLQNNIKLLKEGKKQIIFNDFITGSDNYKNNKAIQDILYGNKLDIFQSVKDTGFLLDLAEQMAIVKEDTAAAITRNLQGDGLPTATVFNLIGDFKNVLREHANRSKRRTETNSNKDMLDFNLFSESDNADLLTRVVFRGDVRDQNGDMKSAKRFNANEIMYQGIFGDFWTQLANDGTFMMEPTVFADKTGQAMINIQCLDGNNSKVINYGSKTYKMSELISGALQSETNLTKADFLYWRTQNRQYAALREKLLNDYKQILLNAAMDDTTRAVIQSKTDINEVVDIIENYAKASNMSFEAYLKKYQGDLDLQYEIHYTRNGRNHFLFKKFKEFSADGKNNFKIFTARIKRENAKFLRDFLQTNKSITVLKPVDSGIINDFGFNEQIEGLTPEFKDIINAYAKIYLGEKATSQDITTAVNDFVKNWVDPAGNLIVAKDAKGKPVKQVTDENIYSEIDYDINPLLKSFLSANRLFMQNFNQAMVGTQAAHEIKIDKQKTINKFKNAEEVEVEIDIEMPDGSIVTETKVFDPPTKLIYNILTAKFLDENPDKTIEEIHEMVHLFLWEEVEEAARTIAMHKRMVAYLATIHPFSQGIITGVSTKMKMMAVEDLKQSVWNTVGDTSSMKAYDGSGWISKTAAILMSNSMGDAATNSDSIKAIRHALDTDTGAAHLDKYAILVTANEQMRMSDASRVPWANLNKVMLNTVKFDQIEALQGKSFLDASFDINGKGGHTVDANQYLQLIQGDSNYAFLNVPAILANRRLTSIFEGTAILEEFVNLKHIGGNDYILIKTLTDIDQYNKTPRDLNGVNGYTKIGDSNLYFKKITINSLYDIWNQVLGGAYSVNIDASNRYAYNDDSHYALVHIMNNVLVDRNPSIKNKEIDQDNYYQPLKDALIWQINNVTGMKNGAKNVNKVDMLTDPLYEAKYFTTDSLHYGIQGNFDHKFSEYDEAHVSEATQVMSAAEVNGYMSKDVLRLYDALSNVIRLQVQNYYEALTGMDSDVALMLTRTLVQAMQTEDRLGIGQAYSLLVMKNFDDLKESGQVKIDPTKDLEYKMAFSDSNFYNFMIQTISSALNRTAIRRKLSGIATIISQSHNSMMVVDSDDGGVMTLNSWYDQESRALRKQGVTDYSLYQMIKDLARQRQPKALEDLGDPLDLGSIDHYDSYVIEFEDGTKTGVIDINSVKDYYDIKKGHYKGNVIEKIYRAKGLPRNLKPQRFEFVANDGTVYSDMEFKATKAIHFLDEIFGVIAGGLDPVTPLEALVKLIYDEVGPNIDKIKERLVIELQREYSEAQKGRFENLDGVIKEGTARTISGEVIMSNFNRHKFGIKEGMQVSDITPEYFKRMHRRSVDKAVNDNFHLAKEDGATFAILRNNKQEIYLLRSEKALDSIDNDLLVKNIKGQDFFVDSNGKPLFEKYYDSLRVYKKDGRYYMTYDNIDQVNRLKFSENTLAIAYVSFKNDVTADVENYINKYDLRSSRFLKEYQQTTRSAFKADIYNKYLDSIIDTIANDMMKSFEQLLNIIGARIPAQSLLSFMAMKIVGFIEKDTNRIYMPIKKNWIDGSDFDIDKSYMMGFSVNKNGKIYSWTNYFDYNHTEKSLEMPISNGKGKQIGDNFDVDLSKDYDYAKIERYITGYMNGEVTSEEDFSELVDFLNDISDAKTIPSTLSPIILQYVNSYFSELISDNTTVLEATKNAAVAALVKISKAPVNMMSANRPVDMNDPSAAAAKSNKAMRAMQWSMDNYSTLPMMKEENGAGKDVISISAVGIKTFTAISHFKNKRIRQLENDLAKLYADRGIELFILDIGTEREPLTEMESALELRVKYDLVSSLKNTIPIEGFPSSNSDLVYDYLGWMGKAIDKHDAGEAFGPISVLGDAYSIYKSLIEAYPDKAEGLMNAIKAVRIINDLVEDVKDKTTFHEGGGMTTVKLNETQKKTIITEAQKKLNGLNDALRGFLDGNAVIQDSATGVTESKNRLTVLIDNNSKLKGSEIYDKIIEMTKDVFKTNHITLIDKSGKRKSLVSHVIANANFDNKPYMNALYDAILAKARKEAEGDTEFADGDDQVKTYMQNGRQELKSQALSNEMPKSMSYVYGGHKRNEVKSTTTIDAIVNGERTATTRYGKAAESYKNYKAGDIIPFQDNKGNVVYVRVTKPLVLLTAPKDGDWDAMAEIWSQKEGWSTMHFNLEVRKKIERGEAYQIEYEFVGGNGVFEDINNQREVLVNVKRKNPGYSRTVEVIDVRKLDDYSLKLSALLSAATDLWQQCCC